MDAYVVGNLVGRLVSSYLIVWCVMLICSRIDRRKAFQRTHRWFGLGCIAMLFAVGLARAV